MKARSLFFLPLCVFGAALASEAVDERVAAESLMGCPLGLWWGMSQAELVESLRTKWGEAQFSVENKGQARRIFYSRVMVSGRYASVGLDLYDGSLTAVGMLFDVPVASLIGSLKARYREPDVYRPPMWMLPSARRKAVVIVVLDRGKQSFVRYEHVTRYKAFEAAWHTNDF